MSNTPNRASNPAGKPRRKDISLDLPTARQMLPLVRSIVTEIVHSRTALNQLNPEQARLERNRRELVWQERQRRYQITEEIASAEKTITTALAELNSLGVHITDAEVGEVDFPTKINGRPAAFSWKLGEERVGHWHYAGEEMRRPIPADWDHAKASQIRFRSVP